MTKKGYYNTLRTIIKSRETNLNSKCCDAPDEKHYSRPLRSLAEDTALRTGYLDVSMAVRVEVRVYLHASQ
jgi:hypothetical protein